MRRTILTAGAVAMCSLAMATTTAGAQYLSINADAPNWGLSSHEVRVVQLALRDADCYNGRIDGRVGPGTRRALRCAQEKTSEQPDQMAQQLALYEAAFVATADGRNTTETTTREAAGDVELAPQRDSVDQMQQQMEPRMEPRMEPQMRDSMMTPVDSMMMPRDSMMAPRDSTLMPPMPRDSTLMPPMPRDTTGMPPMPRDTTTMPMPRDTTRTPPDTSSGRIPPPR